MSHRPPRHPGWAIFHGIRHSTRPGAIEQIHEPVKIIAYPYPTFSEHELVVKMAGRAATYSLRSFEGEWQPLAVSGTEAATK